MPESERRRTSRQVKRVDYSELGEVLFPKTPPQQKPSSSRGRKASSSSSPSYSRKSPTYTVRGRVYDSERGVTCHWCRQKTVEKHVRCTGEECLKLNLPVQFCAMCLRNRHGEDIDLAMASREWVCPRCRGSCGEACESCCNCGPCRKKKGLQPTHQLIRVAQEHRFDNVHDFLIWRNVGGTPELIKERKKNFVWGQRCFDKSLCHQIPSEEEDSLKSSDGDEPFIDINIKS